MSLMGPEFERREDALRQRLANQGIPQSANAFNAELGRFEDTQNRALQDAALQAVLAGSAEQTAELNRTLSLLGLGQPLQPGFVNVAPVDIPFSQGGGGGMSMGQGALSGAASGAAAGTAIMPGWGTAIGGIGGGLLGAFSTR